MAEQQNEIAILDFLIRAGVDDTFAVAFDANDARSGTGA
jgi:hypothetical protein